MFHYNHLPGVDGLNYNTWFQELKQSYPMLELREANQDLKCGIDTTVFGLQQIAMSPSGGVFVGTRTILTHLPEQWRTTDFFSFFPKGEAGLQKNQGIFFAKRAYPSSDFGKFVSEMLEDLHPCVSEDEFDTKHPEVTSPLAHNIQDVPVCVYTNEEDHYFPKDIMKSTTPTYHLAKWFYYGREGDIEAQPG